MAKYPWRAIGALAVFMAAPSVPAIAEPVTPTRVLRAERAGVSPELWSMLAESRPFDSLLVFEIPNDLDQVRGKQRIVFDQAASADEALQTFESPLAMPAPIANFDGVNQRDQADVSGFQVSPPDTVGDVGPDHYVECVNLACRIYSKLGVPAGGAFTISSLFASLGGQCDSTNDGDPIVLYDPLADRWLLSQFAVTNRPPSHECIAISQTADPTGAWYVYDFVIPDNYFNDYPKLGVWPDGYYMTAPLFDGPVFGQGVFVLERQKMLAGDPAAAMLFFDLALSLPNTQRILPADLDGPAPPAGTPNYLATLTAAEFGDIQDGIRLFELQTDWTNPGASTLGEIPFAGGSLAVAAYDPTLTEVSGTDCDPGAPIVAFTNRDDIEQPSPANCGHRVDSLSNRPMHRLAYRNFDTHESLVFTHTVDANATAPTATSGHLAAPRYYELRRSLPGGGWAVQEQATYAPDAVHRFMGSAAMDAEGNLAVGYSVSSTSVSPGVRYAGRLAADPPGGLSQGEASLIAGNASQTSTGSRWGDYSALSVDPADDCTFWYTQQYYERPIQRAARATACWKTRIGSFMFPGCTSPTQTGTLSGTVTDFNTAAAIAGALVQTTNGYTAFTDGAGSYSIEVPAGSYSAYATKTGYTASPVAAVAVTAAQTTTQNFALTNGGIAGVVRNAISLAAIPGARVEISNGTVVTTNGSGAYSVRLPAGSYGVAVSAAGYYGGALAGVTVGTSGSASGDVSLQPAPVLAVTATVIDDWHGGNGNGGVDADECVRLSLTLTNSGAINATAVSATLATSAPHVTVTAAVSAYPDLNSGGGSGANVTPFEITAGPGFVAGLPIAFTLNVTTGTGSLAIPVTLQTAGGTSTSFAAQGPVAIPDNNATGASLAVSVAGFTSTLSKVVVKTRITHTYSGDLFLRLVGPDGAMATLAFQTGGAGAGYGSGSCPTPTFTVFDDAAATPIYAGAAPFNGSFQPQQTLSVFAGKSGVGVNGAWQFQAIDLGPADVGSIQCVELWLNGTLAGGSCSGLFRDDFESAGVLRWDVHP